MMKDANRPTAARLSRAISSKRANKAISLSLPSWPARMLEQPTRASGLAGRSSLAAVSQVAACGQVSRLPDFPSFRRLWLAPNTHPASLMVSTLRPTLVSLLSFRPAATCVAGPPLSLPALRLFPNVLTSSADQRFLRRSLRSARHGRNGEQCTAEWNSVQQNLAIFCATWVQ